MKVKSLCLFVHLPVNSINSGIIAHVIFWNIEVRMSKGSQSSRSSVLKDLELDWGNWIGFAIVRTFGLLNNIRLKIIHNWCVSYLLTWIYIFSMNLNTIFQNADSKSSQLDKQSWDKLSWYGFKTEPFKENPSTSPLRRAISHDLTFSINPLSEFFLIKPTTRSNIFGWKNLKRKLMYIFSSVRRTGLSSLPAFFIFYFF